MLRRLLPVLLTALVAVAGLEALPATTTGLLVAAAFAAALAVAAGRMLAHASRRSRTVRAVEARDSWLEVTATFTPTHTDARALMRPRPPSASR